MNWTGIDPLVEDEDDVRFEELEAERSLEAAETRRVGEYVAVVPVRVRHPNRPKATA